MKRTNTCDPARLKERESLMKFARRNYMHTETSVIFSLFQKMTGSCGYRPNLGSRDGRVEDWRAGLGRSLYSLFLALSFASVTLSRPCHVSSPPPRRTQRADFPHCAPLFASPQGLWDLSCWATFGISQRTL